MERQIKKRKDDIYRQTLANLAKLEQEKQDDDGGIWEDIKEGALTAGGLALSPLATVSDMAWKPFELIPGLPDFQPESVRSVNLAVSGGNALKHVTGDAYQLGRSIFTGKDTLSESPSAKAYQAAGGGLLGTISAAGPYLELAGTAAPIAGSALRGAGVLAPKPAPFKPITTADLAKSQARSATIVPDTTPVEMTIDDLLSYVRRARTMGSNPKKMPEELKALADYFGPNFPQYQEALRNGLIDDFIAANVAKAQRFFETSYPLEQPTVLYRGIKDDNFLPRQQYANFIKGLKVGDVIDEPGFMSTTIDYDMAEGFANDGIVLQIEAPRGTRVGSPLMTRDLAPVYADPERELLLPPNTKLQITDINDKLIQAKIVPADTPSTTYRTTRAALAEDIMATQGKQFSVGDEIVEQVTPDRAEGSFVLYNAQSQTKQRIKFSVVFEDNKPAIRIDSESAQVLASAGKPAVKAVEDRLKYLYGNIEIVTAPDTPAPAGLASTAMQDLAQAQARNATHIGTVSRGPVEVISSQPFNQIEGMGWFKGGLPNPESSSRQVLEIPVYEIGGKRVAFGNTNIDRFNPEMDLSGVEVVPLNPYEISNLSSASKEGQEMAMRFTDALNGRGIEALDQGAFNFNNKDQLQVFALQYAASRGDKVAAAELERLAKVGRELVTQQRLAEAQQQQQYVSQFLRGDSWESVPGMDVAIGLDATGKKIYRPIGIDDIFLVHQTRYKPPVDADGNVILNPASDFYMIDPETGKPYTDFVTGEPLPKPNRHTIHFALNHVVGGNMWRQTPDVDTFAIVVPLRDVLDANPGSLDNLFAVDTYFTPKPGEGLVLPMKSGKVVEIPGVSRYGSVGPTADTLERVAAEGKQIVADAMHEVGQAHNKFDGYKVKSFPDYGTSSDDIVDVRMADLATGDIPKQYKEYGPKVEHQLHSASAFSQIEEAMFPGSQHSHWVWALPLDTLSPNARLRLFDTNVFGSGEVSFPSRSWEDEL
jgi:hypothetical protein